MEKINDLGNSEPSQATKKIHSTGTKERPEREAEENLARKARATALKQDDEWRTANGLPPPGRTGGLRSVCPTGRVGRGVAFHARGPSYRDNGLPPRERTRGRRSACPTGRGGRGVAFNAGGPSYRDNGPFEPTCSADLSHLHFPSRTLERDTLEKMSDYSEHALFHFTRINAPEVLNPQAGHPPSLPPLPSPPL